MDEFPHYKFVCSQAQQHTWMKEEYPELFERMRKKVTSGQFEPVGSMWVEPDCNVPSGEWLARQLVLRQALLPRRIRVRGRDVWLPDVFGYFGEHAAAHAPRGDRLVPHPEDLVEQHQSLPASLFWWQGIDGTRIFSHFPPSDTYNGDVSVRERCTSPLYVSDGGKWEKMRVPSMPCHQKEWCGKRLVSFHEIFRVRNQSIPARRMSCGMLAE